MRHMPRFDGSLARTLDFGETSGTTTTTTVYAGARAGLRLASPGGLLRGPDKYKVLEHRRRQAQIAARRVVDLLDAAGDPRSSK
jgi:hypothetical protein